MSSGRESLGVDAGIRFVNLELVIACGQSEPLPGFRLDSLPLVVGPEQVARDPVEPRQTRAIHLVTESLERERGLGERLGGELTCDPVGSPVPKKCVNRNGVPAVELAERVGVGPVRP